MAESSKIEWTTKTWNPIVGCETVSPGCTNCYAMREAWRLSLNPKTPQYVGTVKKGKGKSVWTGKMGLSQKALEAPLRRRKPTTWFVNSMGDLFAENVPEEWIDRVFAVMALAPQHTFQVLTKRADRMRSYLMGLGCDGARRFNVARAAGWMMEDGDNAADEVASSPWPLPNVWLGVSVEDQTRADERIPALLNTPAAVRFVSAEPLLGPVDFIVPMSGAKIDALAGARPAWSPLDWIIVGGESGPGARPMRLVWARSIRDQCKAAGVPFFFKQWGDWLPMGQSGFTAWSAANVPKNGMSGRKWLGFAHFNDGAGGPETARIGPCETCNVGDFKQSIRLGKAAAGRLLDGREWNEMPEASQ